MAPVAKRLAPAVLAETPSHGGLLGHLVLHGHKFSSLVTPVTEWLSLRFSAGAPKIGARLNFLHTGFAIRNVWLGHEGSLGENGLSNKKQRSPYRPELLSVTGVAGSSALLLAVSGRSSRGTSVTVAVGAVG